MEQDAKRSPVLLILVKHANITAFDGGFFKGSLGHLVGALCHSGKHVCNNKLQEQTVSLPKLIIPGLPLLLFIIIIIINIQLKVVI